MNVNKTYRALSLHGWKVAASHATAGSKVAIDEISEFASLPVRPLFTLTDVLLILLRRHRGRYGKRKRAEVVILSLVGLLTVGHNVPTGRPKALEETEDLRRNSIAGCT